MFGITKIITVFFVFVIHLLQFFISVRYYKKKKFVPVFFFVSVLQVSALPITLPILFVNIFCFYPSEMASPSTPINPILNHGENPQRFNDTDFKIWQQKMLFYLTTLNLARFVTPRPYEEHSTCNCKGAYVHQVPL